MSDNGKIQVDNNIVERLKRSIIIKENMNLKTRTMNDSQMVATVYKGNIIKINNGLPILRRETAQTRLRAVFL